LKTSTIISSKMTYQSPLHILDSLHITPDELTPEGITRLRKKLLAEFSLTSDITIEVNGQSYTKDEILKVIDQLIIWYYTKQFLVENLCWIG
jgi:hypothetical protein